MQKMLFSKAELKALSALGGLMSVRMLGLFMLLPILATHAQEWQGSTKSLIGIALGVYGFTQALLQIPFGWLSDKIGRKNVISAGLVFFILGSLLAFWSESIWGLILGRLVQGAGAIGCVILATAADVTREHVRSGAMAMLGITIGMSFILAMIIGPMFGQLWGVRSVFAISILLGFLGILIVWRLVPNVVRVQNNDAIPMREFFGTVLKDKNLLLFDLGVLLLHAILAGCFLVLPLLLKPFIGEQALWQFYCPILLASLVVAIPVTIIGDKRQSDIALWFGWLALGFALLVLMVWHQTFFGLSMGMLLFFCGFNALEAHFPARVSRSAPSQARGTAMGIFSSAQFLGVFFGGMIGGRLDAEFGILAVLGACLAAVICWLVTFFWVRYQATKHTLVTSFSSF